MTTRASTLQGWAALLAVLTAAMVVSLAVGNEPAKAAFPGDNGAIAFQGQADQLTQIYRMDSDGFGPTKLSDAPGNNGDPNWSADGKKITFGNLTGTENLDNEVYWMNSDGSGETNLTNNPAHDYQPAFFPDHHTIAFVSTRDGGDADIFKMTVDDNGNVTDGPIQMTTGTALDIQPAVSPDGSKIAFASDRDGGDDFDVYVMNANAPESSTNEPIKLTKRSANDSSPEWSPKGGKIAFHSPYRGGNLEVYTMKPVPQSTTNRPRNLTKNPAHDWQPAFSPSGGKLAFTSDRDGGDFDIFKMNADGSGPVNLTNNSGDDRHPSWQPDP